MPVAPSAHGSLRKDPGLACLAVNRCWMSSAPCHLAIACFDTVPNRRGTLALYESLVPEHYT
eukprot:12824954-Alexandrium_andersonii.AAC.1